MKKDKTLIKKIQDTKEKEEKYLQLVKKAKEIVLSTPISKPS